MKLVSFALIIATVIGCNRNDQNAGAGAKAKPVDVKVAIFADGSITVDGKPAALEELAKHLESTKNASGTVWYFREAANDEPHPNAMKVMELVLNNRLPITLSTKPDFSDVVGPDGIPRPR
jgi:biopolymer transport protein ExbD